MTRSVEPGSGTALKFERLLAGVEDVRILRGADHPIASIAYDSRAVEPGGLFVALRGSYVDGHDYLAAARVAGAAACLIDRSPNDADVAGFRAVAWVADSRRALAQVARTFYGDPSRAVRLVGITGTDGKTTTSFMIAHLLRSAGLRTGLIGTVAIQIPDREPLSAGRQTTPESLDTQRLLAAMGYARADVVILETSSHGLETHRVDGCRFGVGLVTNITHEHLDFHGSLDAYRRAKARLFDLVRAAGAGSAAGIAIVNHDDAGARAIAGHADGLTLLRYGEGPSRALDVAATDVTADAGGFRFTLSVAGEQVDTALPMLGDWNVSNALGAVAVCHALGLPIQPLADAMRSMPPVPGRMEAVDAGQPFQLIVDYAHTGPALGAVLASARASTSGRVLVVFGSAGERDIEKRREMGAVAARGSDYFIVTSEDPRYEDPEAIIAQIATGAVGAGATEGVDFDRLEDRRRAIAHILERAESGDIVILAGKGHERSMIYGAEAHLWHEAGIARDILKSMGYTNDL